MLTGYPQAQTLFLYGSAVVFRDFSPVSTGLSPQVPCVVVAAWISTLRRTSSLPRHNCRIRRLRSCRSHFHSRHPHPRGRGRSWRGPIRLRNPGRSRSSASTGRRSGRPIPSCYLPLQTSCDIAHSRTCSWFLLGCAPGTPVMVAEASGSVGCVAAQSHEAPVFRPPSSTVSTHRQMSPSSACRNEREATRNEKGCSSR